MKEVIKVFIDSGLTFLSKPLLVRIMDKLTEKEVIEIAEEYVKQDSRDIEIMNQ
jgi:hypothetical protein